jgi:hypothetical protein
MSIPVPQSSATNRDNVTDADWSNFINAIIQMAPQVQSGFGGAVPFYSGIKCQKVALAAVDTGGGIFSWQNPESVTIIVDRVVLDVTTVASAACSVEVGGTATNGTTASANLITAQDVHSATGQFDSLLAAVGGASGLGVYKCAAGKWITGSTSSGASAGLVGSAYIYYILA